MYVREWMTKPVYSARVQDTVAEALELMSRYRFRHLPVLEDGRLAGIVTERDLGRLNPEFHQQTSLRFVIKTEVITAVPSDPLDQAARVMEENKIGCLPVLDDGKLTGMLTESDLYRAFVSMTGAAEPSTRLMVHGADRPSDLARLFQALEEHSVRLVSVVSAPAERGHRSVLLRVKLFNALPLVRALEEAGFRVDKPEDLADA